MERTSLWESSEAGAWIIFVTNLGKVCKESSSKTSFAVRGWNVDVFEPQGRPFPGRVGREVQGVAAQGAVSAGCVVFYH